MLVHGVGNPFLCMFFTSLYYGADVSLCLTVLEIAHYESDAVVNYLIAFHVMYGVIFLLTVVEKAGEM